MGTNRNEGCNMKSLREESILSRIGKATFLGFVLFLAGLLLISGSSMTKAGNPESSGPGSAGAPTAESRGIENSGWTNDYAVSYTKNPAISVDKSNYLWLAYEHFNSTSGRYEIYLSRSIDNGKTWVYMAKVASASYNYYNPDIAVDVGDSNKVYVVYELASTYYEIQIMQYYNSQVTITDIYSISGYNCRNPSIAIEFTNGASDRIWVAFERIISAGYACDILVSRSTDDSANWATYLGAGTGSSGGPYYCQPSACIGPSANYLYVAYRSGADYSSVANIDYLYFLPTGTGVGGYNYNIDGMSTN